MWSRCFLNVSEWLERRWDDVLKFRWKKGTKKEQRGKKVLEATTRKSVMNFWTGQEVKMLQVVKIWGQIIFWNQEINDDEKEPATEVWAIRHWWSQSNFIWPDPGVWASERDRDGKRCYVELELKIDCF